MGIKFGAPWWLLLFIPAAALIVWWWRCDARLGQKKKLVLASVRALIFLLLILALADVQLTFPERGKTVVFVADLSASLNKDKEVRDYIARAVEGKSPDDRYAVIAVGREAMVDQMFTTREDGSALSSVVTKHQTDLAAGLRLASGLIPEGSKGRVVLISDGEQTRGDAVQEAKLLRKRGVTVNTVYMASGIEEEALVADVNVPPRLFPGEEYTVAVRLDSTADTDGVLRLYDGDREMESRKVALKKGENRVTFTTKAKSPGFRRFHVKLEADKDTLTANNESYAFTEVIGKPKVLVVEGTRHAAVNLMNALKATGVDVERLTVQALPEQLESYKQYQSIVLANVPAFEFGEKKMKLIQTAVRDFGVGFVMTGGSDSFGLGGWFRTPVEEALPVYMDLRNKEKRPSLGLILVIDKSGSMAGHKMELAKEAAIRSTQMLTEQDQIGVIAFDDGFWWTVKATPVKDISRIQDDVGSIVADGGTSIYPALEEAYQVIKTLKMKRKHIILLTDGQSQSAGYDDLIRQMKKEKVTLSTVAVGSDADTALLDRLAQEAKGRYYFAYDDTTIPTIFSKETALATRSFAVEKPFRPILTGGRDWVNGISGLPPLGGYVATTPKERAEIVMTSPEPDPVAARWLYGLGKSVAWTSDVSGNWSKHWVTWEHFSEWVNRMISWTFPEYRQGDWSVALTQENGRGKIALQLPDGAETPEGTLQVTVVKNDLSKETVPLKGVAPGTYEAEFPADEPGVYMLQMAEGQGEEILRSETYGTAVPYSPEYRLPENGERNMEAIADAGNGTMFEDPGQVFDGTMAKNWSQQPVGGICLLLAMLLFPLDIAIRRVSVSPKLLVRLRRAISRSFRPQPVGTRSKATSGQLNGQREATDGPFNGRREATERRRQTDGSPSLEPGPPLETGEPTTVTTGLADHGEGEEQDVRSSQTSRSARSEATDPFARLLAAKNRARRR